MPDVHSFGYWRERKSLYNFFQFSLPPAFCNNILVGGWLHLFHVGVKSFFLGSILPFQPSWAHVSVTSIELWATKHWQGMMCELGFFYFWKVGLHNSTGKVAWASMSKASVSFCSQRVEASHIDWMMTLAAESTLTANRKIKKAMLSFYGISKTYWRIWASLVVQTVKNLPAMQKTCVQSLGWEDPLEKGMATYSNILGSVLQLR